MRGVDDPLLSDDEARDLLFVVTSLAMFYLAVDVWRAYLVYPAGWLAQLIVGSVFALTGVGLLVIRFTQWDRFTRGDEVGSSGGEP